MAWPDRLNMGSPRESSLFTLHSNRWRFKESPEEFTSFHAPSEWLLGFAIPPFQRPVVWDEERMIRFMESAILGLHLGTYTVNSTFAEAEALDQNGEPYYPYDLWLIDGQQRLTALDRYWDDQFPVFGVYWSEVPKIDARKFLMHTHFSSFETRLTNEDDLRELYDRMNFGGVAHTPDQRATPQR